MGAIWEGRLIRRLLFPALVCGVSRLGLQGALGQCMDYPSPGRLAHPGEVASELAGQAGVIRTGGVPSLRKRTL